MEEVIKLLNLIILLIRKILKQKRWLSPDELFQEFGISKNTQAKMRMSKRKGSRIPYSKIGNKYIFYDRLIIYQWLENNEVLQNES